MASENSPSKDYLDGFTLGYKVRGESVELSNELKSKDYKEEDLEFKAGLFDGISHREYLMQKHGPGKEPDKPPALPGNR